MPSKSRFGSGSLLGPVAPLPDLIEDEQPPAPLDQRDAAEPEPEPIRTAAPPPAPLGDGSRLAEIAADAADTARGRKGPPSTLRINEAAGLALWESYLAAKNEDPFLSFRQFTSAIVLEGLDRERRRRRR